jgi:hypothetical protein
METATRMNLATNYLTVEAINGSSSYNEEDDSSLDGTLIRLAVLGGPYDAHLAQAADFS